MNTQKGLFFRKFPLTIILICFVFQLHAQKEDSLSYLSNDDEYNIVMASLRGDYEMVKNLLEKGIDVNIVLEESISPLINAARGGNTRIAALLLSKGANVNINPREGHTPLITAVKYRQYRMVDFLVQKGASVNQSNDVGRTPLMYAAAMGDSTLVSVLLQKGATAQLRDTIGTDALMASVSKGDLIVSEMLLLAGARADSCDQSGITPIMLAAANLDYNHINMLLAFNGNINAKSKHKHTALTLAIMQNDEQFVQYLMELGADVNQKLTMAETPLTVARYMRSDIFLIDNMLEKGATENFWPDVRKAFIGPVFSMNNNDFMAGVSLGIRDYKYELDLAAGFLIRPYASRILDSHGADTYYQFWERRHLYFIQLNKHFLFNINKFRHRYGMQLGLKGIYSKSSYRGINFRTDDQIIIAPEAGFYYTTRMLSAGINYSYCDFKKEGVAPHKMDVYIRFLIGKAFIFNKSDYKIWE